jgi:uncharacterized protein YjbJ (UPF0337 family)
MFGGYAFAHGEAEECLAACFTGGYKMKSGAENEVAGQIHEVKGTIKEKIGQLTNDPDLEGEGIGEKIAGKVQKKIGRVERVVEKP